MLLIQRFQGVSPHPIRGVGIDVGTKSVGRLTSVNVRNAKPGRHGDGSGLYLLVKASGSRSWLLRIQQYGRRRDIGLGSVAALNLAEAREKAAELRKHALNGRDPIAERDRDRGPIPAFKEAAQAAHAELKAMLVSPTVGTGNTNKGINIRAGCSDTPPALLSQITAENRGFFKL